MIVDSITGFKQSGMLCGRPWKISQQEMEGWHAREWMNSGFQFLVTLISTQWSLLAVCLLAFTLFLSPWVWSLLFCLEGPLQEISGREGSTASPGWWGSLDLMSLRDQHLLLFDAFLVVPTQCCILFKQELLREFPTIFQFPCSSYQNRKVSLLKM